MVIGIALSMVISGALVIATAKAGISPGVSPLVVLIGWVVFGSIMRDRLKPFLAILQVTGSGGAAVSAGLIFTAPIIQISAQLMDQPTPEVNVFTTWLACLSGSLMGWGFVGLAAKRFLTDPRLPAPEAVACDQLIETASQSPDERPPVSVSLLPALVAGFFVRALVFLGWLKDIAFMGKIRLAWAGTMSLPFPVDPLFLGIGALLTFPTALLVFCGGLVNAVTKTVSVKLELADETYRWVGGAAMVVAVLYSLINYAIEGRKKAAIAAKKNADSPEQFDERLLDIPAHMRGLLIGAISGGAAILIWILFRANITLPQVAILGVVSLLLVSVLSGLGGLLSLQVGASASPVSGTVFMAMLVLSITAVALSLTGFVAIETLQPVLVASCVAIAAANDSSQDYKTVQLNGYPVAQAFGGQFLGCVAGACVVPFALAVAHKAFQLGSEALPCPQASFFGTVLTSLFDPDQAIPWGPVGVGAILGLVAVGIEMAGRARGVILSSLAFAVGIYLPAVMGIGILMGNLARVVATWSFKRSSHRGILAAAGLIAGDSLFSLLAGVLIVCGVSLSVFETKESWPVIVSILALVSMLGLLVYTYLDGRRDEVR